MTTAQLRDCGLTHGMIGRWRDKDVLQRLHRGVYAFGVRSPAPEAQWTAALLAAGDGAHLCRIAALALYGLWDAPRVTHVTVPKQRRGDATLRIRTTKHPERTHRRRFPTTPLPRTFLDLAADGFPIERVVHKAAARRLVRLTALRDYARANRGRAGAKVLLRAATNPHYRSLSERDFHAWLAARGIVAEPNTPIGGLTVDFDLPQHGIVIELDTEQTHGTAHAGRTDGERDARLRDRGLEVVRVEPAHPA